MAAEKWHFFWKNIDGLGKFNRIAAGLGLVAAAFVNKQSKLTALIMGAMGLELVASGFMHWCFLRALLRRPTRRARKARLEAA